MAQMTLACEVAHVYFSVYFYNTTVHDNHFCCSGHKSRYRHSLRSCRADRGPPCPSEEWREPSIFPWTSVSSLELRRDDCVVQSSVTKPSRNTYCLTWVSLTLDIGYLFTAAPAKHSCCSLPWTRDISTTPPDLERGVVPLGLLCPCSHHSLDLGLLLYLRMNRRSSIN